MSKNIILSISLFYLATLLISSNAQAEGTPQFKHCTYTYMDQPADIAPQDLPAPQAYAEEYVGPYDACPFPAAPPMGDDNWKLDSWTTNVDYYSHKTKGNPNCWVQAIGVVHYGQVW